MLADISNPDGATAVTSPSASAMASPPNDGAVSPDPPPQYHPTAEKLKTSRKNRHRRTGSHGSGNFAYLQKTSSPRESPIRERRTSCHGTPRSARASPRQVQEQQQQQLQQRISPMRQQDLTEVGEEEEGAAAVSIKYPVVVDSSSSDFECKIIAADAADDDYLETLDRKVSEIVNRERNPLPGGPAAFARSGSRRRSSRVSPGQARRVSSSTSITATTPTQNQPAVKDVIRFDDSDSGGETTDSRDEDEDEAPPRRWSDDDTDSDSNPRFMLRRRSTIRRPIRAKTRLSVMSVSTVSSTEDQATTEYPCSSSQRSTLEGEGGDSNGSPSALQRQLQLLQLEQQHHSLDSDRTLRADSLDALEDSDEATQQQPQSSLNHISE